MPAAVVFNALCVLCAALALNPREIRGVIPNVRKAEDGVRRGLNIVSDIAKTSGHAKIAKSEQFLQKLMQAAFRHSKDVSLCT